MKGTRPRGTDPASDRRYARELAESAQDRAENLMIVDIFRTELSRISRAVSVKVDKMFRAYPYTALFLMRYGVSAVIGCEKSRVRNERFRPCKFRFSHVDYKNNK